MKKIFCFGVASLLILLAYIFYSNGNHKVNQGELCLSDVESLTGCEISTTYSNVQFDRCEGTDGRCKISYHGSVKVLGKEVRIDADMECDGKHVQGNY